LESNSGERIKRALNSVWRMQCPSGNETASSLPANAATEDVARAKAAMQPRAGSSPLPSLTSAGEEQLETRLIADTSDGCQSRD